MDSGACVGVCMCSVTKSLQPWLGRESFIVEKICKGTARGNEAMKQKKQRKQSAKQPKRSQFRHFSYTD